MLLVFNKKRQQSEFARSQPDGAKRIYARNKVLRPGKITLNTNQEDTYECIVVDLSDTGAKLLVHNPYELTDTFQLSFASGKVVYNCRTVWKSKDEVGAEFIFQEDQIN